MLPYLRRLLVCICTTLVLNVCVPISRASASSDGTDDAVHWSRSEFVIPFQIDPSGEVPAEVRLEVSEDQGRSWNVHARADVRTRQFQYRALRDGEVHFRLKTVDRKGNVFENPGAPLVVMVDTTKPTGELLVDIDPRGTMQLECRITEVALDRQSLKAEFQTDVNPQWLPIVCDVQSGERDDQWVFFGTWEIPSDASQVVVRVRVRDRAGNTSEWTRMPRLPRSAAIGREMMLASNPERSQDPKRIGAGILAPPKTVHDDFPKVEVLGGTGAQRPRPQPDRDVQLRDQVLESQQRLIEYQNRFLMQQRATAKPSESLIVSESPSLEPDLASIANPKDAAQEESGSLDGLQSNVLHSNRRQFSLDYAIDNTPGESITNIELWGTIDRGNSWQKWGTDPDRQSPFDIEVAEDGLFGFRMVIVGGNGIASKRPLPGDQADAWIRVDTEAPQARIVRVSNGKNADSGSLVIEFQASDAFFGERPISFFCSENAKGPWHPIAHGARNSGRYVWTPDADSPPTVYLRIQAIDAAGNITSHLLDLPVDVQSATPRGRIQGFHSPAR